jgi:hypothetical protein
VVGRPNSGKTTLLYQIAIMYLDQYQDKTVLLMTLTYDVSMQRILHLCNSMMIDHVDI